MILRLFEQDVQISGTKTGSLVFATLRNHTAVRVSPSHYLGTRSQGQFSFGYFSLVCTKKSITPLKGGIKTQTKTTPDDTDAPLKYSMPDTVALQ
jgi:hypothetical protein